MKFGLVSWFASEGLKGVALKLLKNVNGQTLVVDWDDGVNKQDEHIIPLFLCENRDDLKRSGALCPHEFVIERTDLLPEVSDKGCLASNAINVMFARLCMLGKLYGTRTRKDFQCYMRDWLAGAFRMYLMLDAATHGTSEFIDLEKVKRQSDPILRALAGFQGDKIVQDGKLVIEKQGKAVDAINAEIANAVKHKSILRARFSDDTPDSMGSSSDSMLRFKSNARHLFQEYFNRGPRSITRIISANDSPEKKLEQLCGIYQDVGHIYTKGERILLGHDQRLPVAFGDRAKYVTPTNKLNLLLIDDNVNDSPFAHLAEKMVDKAGFANSIAQDDWDLLRDIFNVQLLPIESSADKDVFRHSVEIFRKLQKYGMTYDLILVDLCLGRDVRGADLDGYAMIRWVKVFFPGTPIVVYSRFSDMGHIARAFFNGAKWFLVKGEEAKLPRHVLTLLKQVGWHREWRSVESSSNKLDFLFEKEDDFSRKFKRMPQWKYLTFKSLEYLPGNIITVKQMGGGISSAVTFKATKGVRKGDESLQTPYIIKIDSSFNTMMEFERYFRMIRPYIANESGRVEKPERVLNRDFSSIVYTFAGKHDKAHELRSMNDMVENDVLCASSCNYENYRYALDCVFDEILPKIHRVSPELEVGDCGGRDVPSSHVADAFTFDCSRLKFCSFPNVYFGEFEPKDFWKSYALRMQPWGRVTIEDKNTFQPQQIIEDISSGSDEWPNSKCKLTFHNVMPDPEPSNGGLLIIEAYTDDKKLVWLDGPASDFIARFRKRLNPGASLWFPEKVIQEANETDERLDWLQRTIALKRSDGTVATISQRKLGSAGDEFFNYVNDLLHKKKTKEKWYTTLQDKIMQIAEKVHTNFERWNCHCPVGIIHGDLNMANIMLEARIHAPKEDDPDKTRTVSDVWFIDFARTRRDLIAHDFNVFFTSVLGTLFAKDLIADVQYMKDINSKFRDFIVGAVSSKAESLKGVKDAIVGDQRLEFVYKMLRRCRMAALKAGVSQNMYLLTTALACLYTLKIFINNKCQIQKAAAYFAAASICYDLLPKEMKDAVP